MKKRQADFVRKYMRELRHAPVSYTHLTLPTTERV